MNEAARFLRYVIPGLVFAIEVLCFLAISDAKLVGTFLQTNLGKQGFGFAAAFFLVSGAIGFIFANVYFGLFDVCDFLIQDHTPVFRKTPPGLKVVILKGGTMKTIDLNSTQISRRQAWTIFVAYWFQVIDGKGGGPLRGVERYTQKLVNITHSLGVTLVGTILSLPTFCLLRHFALAEPPSVLSPWQCLILIGLWAVLLTVFWVARQQTKVALERIANSAMMAWLKKKANVLEEVLYVE